MTPEIVPIGLGQLFVGLGFIIVAGITSLLHSLKLERDLLAGNCCKTINPNAYSGKIED